MISWSKNNHVWEGTVLPLQNKCLIGMHVENPEWYQQGVDVTLGGLIVHGEMDSKGTLFFWQPFRLPLDLLVHHTVVLRLTPKADQPAAMVKACPNVHLEWDISTPSEVDNPSNMEQDLDYPILLLHENCGLKSKYDRERRLNFIRHNLPHVNFPVNNILRIRNGMLGLTYFA